MVTGVKVTKGVSVSGGPHGEVERKSEVGEAYGSCSDFLFAYRVQRVYISWLWGNVKAKEKVGGDLTGIGDQDDIEEDDIEIDLDEDEDDENEPKPEGIAAVRLERDVWSENVPDGFVKSIAGGVSGEDEGEDFLFQKSTV
jgi:hypothetical protein